MRDFILRVPDAGLLVRRTELKKAMAGLFGDRHDGERSNYLFSAEPRMEIGPWVRVRLLDGELPSKAAPFVRELEVPRLSAGDAVMASSWMALKTRVHGATASETRANVVARLNRVRELFEAAIDITTYDFDERYGVARIERGKERYARPYSLVRVTGSVRDPVAASALMTAGIGAGKAYGFGLVDIQQTKDQAS